MIYESPDKGKTVYMREFGSIKRKLVSTKKTVALVTGGFDPLHSGHIEYIKAASKLADVLVVGLNSDAWLTRKKGRVFLPVHERRAIIENLSFVNHVMEFNDDNNNSENCIRQVLDCYPDSRVLFANGGDRVSSNVPEADIFQDDSRVSFAFGVGGEHKMNSSSWILQEWKAPKTLRPWGYYRVIHEVPGAKVKELTVNPGQKLSMQRHQHRNEFWLLTQGQATVYGSDNDSVILNQHDSTHINKMEWHQLANNTDQLLKLVEIQFGSECSESDIERHQ